MYKYLDLETEYYQGLLESLGKADVLEIIVKEIPVNYEKYIRQAEEAISAQNYAQLKLCVHTIKSDFRHFIPETHPIIQFIQDFENRAKDSAEASGGSSFDFTPDLNKLKELTQEPLKEIRMLQDEYENE